MCFRLGRERVLVRKRDAAIGGILSSGMRKWRLLEDAWACDGGLAECFRRVREVYELGL